MPKAIAIFGLLILFISFCALATGSNLYGYPTQNPSTCTDGALTGTICAGCGGTKGGEIIGTYTFKIIPTNGGIIVRLENINIPSSCQKGSITKFHLNIDLPNATQVTAPGQSKVPKQPATGFGVPITDINPPFTRGWSSTNSPTLSTIQWYIGGLTPCSTLGITIHFEGTDCSGSSQTLYGGGGPGGVPGVGAISFTNSQRWGWSLNVTDCAACKTTMQCNKVDNSCTPTTVPVASGASTTVTACPYISDNVTCQALAAQLDCTEGYCKPDFTCSLNAKPNGCAIVGITPLVKCVYCNSTVCWAELGYDSTSLTANTETVTNGAVFRSITSTNNFIRSNANTGSLYWGQPSQFVYQKLVLPAFTVFFSPSETLTWSLDGKNVTLSSSGNTPCLNPCEIAGQITSSAFANSDGSKTFLYQVSNNELGCGFPSNFLIDTPMSCSKTPQVSVSPSSCLDTTRQIGYVVNNVNFDAQLDQGDLNCVLSSVNNPLSIPLVQSSACIDVNITISFPSSTCSVPIGIGKVSQVYGGSCSGCSACRVLPLLGPQSDCPTVGTCTAVGSVWDKTSCSCQPCTTTCSSPNKLVKTAGACSCQPCTAPTCTLGTRVVDVCDSSCTPCPTLSCQPPTYPQPLNQVAIGSCPTCLQCTKTCPANSTISYTDCTCQPCPNTCTANQVAKNGDLCQGCTACPTPTCAKNSTVTQSKPCECTPCTNTCPANFVYVDPSDICKGCTPCTPPTCPKNSSLSDPSKPCTCIPCTGFPCAAGTQPVDPLDSCKGCQPCTPNCLASNNQKVDPNDACKCVTCVPPVCDPNFQTRASQTTNCTTCIPCTPPGSCPAGQYYDAAKSTCGCQPCDAAHCQCVEVTCPKNTKPDKSALYGNCPCVGCPAPNCPATGWKVDPTDNCTCVACVAGATCTSTQYADPNDSCKCLNCVAPTCDPNFFTSPSNPCGTCTPCVPPSSCPTNQYLDHTVSTCSCQPCDSTHCKCTVQTCPANSTADLTVVSTGDCPCIPCTNKVCPTNYKVDPLDSCSCIPCVAGATCDPDTQYADPANSCNCLNCVAPTCDPNFEIDPSTPCGECTPCTPPGSCPAGQYYDATKSTCGCQPCDAAHCQCVEVTCPKNTKPDKSALYGNCPCVGCPAPTCPATGWKVDPTDNCTCIPCVAGATCTATQYADPDDSCKCLNCVETICPANFKREDSSDPCNHNCLPCDPLSTVCQSGEFVDPTDSCNCVPCPSITPCPTGTSLNVNSLPCPTCDDCTKTKNDCGANKTVSESNPCQCVDCAVVTCGKGSRLNLDDICNGCVDCPALSCPANQQPVDPLDSCAGCKDCVQTECPAGQTLVDPNDLCSTCQDCVQPTCGYGEELAADLCSCTSCTPNCGAGYVVDDTGCSCTVCQPNCPDWQTIDPSNVCACVNVTIPPPPPPPPSCPSYYDACGVCGGKNRTCIDCSGCINCGQPRYVDACGVVCGDGTTCPGCHGDLCSVCTKPLDLCGICGGNSTTCYGCDGVPASGAIYDWCGICGGNGTSCLGCDGKPNTTACSPAPIPAAAVGAISSLLALASLGAIALAAILWRMRKRPEVLFQAWENEIEDYLAEIQNNPLHNDAGNTHVSPLFELGHAGH